mgnify:CR=1 FL=1
MSTSILVNDIRTVYTVNRIVWTLHLQTDEHDLIVYWRTFNNHYLFAMTNPFPTSLTVANYYDDGTYLSSSALSNFVSFDYRGSPVYNFLTFLNPPRVDSDAVLIGSAVDGELTEGTMIDDVYWPSLDRAGIDELCNQYGITINKSKAKDAPPVDTIKTLREKLLQAGHIFLKEMPPKVYANAKSIIETAHAMMYDPKTTYMQFIKECSSQCIVTDEEWLMKGKFDHYNPKRKVIADLKTTGKFDKLLQELYYNGQVNIYHKYVRQLAIYRELVFRKTGEYFKCELIVIGYSGQAMILDIPALALDDAMVQVKKDIAVLNSYRFPGDDRKETLHDNYHIELQYVPWVPVVNMELPEVEEPEEETDPLSNML